MEDSPHFNAGHGAALNEAAEHELDASIMDGATLAAGAVCAVRRMRNPVLAARAVLDSRTCRAAGGRRRGRFRGKPGTGHGRARVFHDTQRRVEALAPSRHARQRALRWHRRKPRRHGTVGAVARDRHGISPPQRRRAASTTSLPAASGTARSSAPAPTRRDGVCAVSCTGQGEIFIRRVAAYDVAARMIYGGQALADAANTLVFDTLASHGIGAGLVALGATGNPVRRSIRWGCIAAGSPPMANSRSRPIASCIALGTSLTR